MRIIAGKHKGRKIDASPGKNVRPTSEFAREGIFNILVHGKLTGYASAVEGAKVLDCFCGTGAFGLEALSRGAAHVTFIDQSRDALELARANAHRFGELNACDFLQGEATQLSRASFPHTLVFLDPPYHKHLLAPALKRLLEQGWLAEGAIIVAEHDEREAFKLPDGLIKGDERRYGRAVVEFLIKES